MSTGKQDDAAGPTVRHIRSAMAAMDKIGEVDVSIDDKMRALERIEHYCGTVMSRVLVEDALRGKRERGEL